MQSNSTRMGMLHVGADGGGVVAGDVEVVLAMAEGAEVGDDHRGVETGVAGFLERALGLVPAPEDGELAGLVGCGLAGEEEEEKEEAAGERGGYKRRTALERHCLRVYTAFG
ncbi:hypothetical protein EJB05_54979, partial [Eragrostis curvula]